MVVCMMNDNFYRSSGAAIAIRRITEAFTDVDYCVAGCGGGSLPEDLSWIPPGRYGRFELKTTNPALLLRELLRFRQWFKAQRCDLVHCHHRRVAVLLQLARIPVLYTGQLTFPRAPWFRLLRPKRMTAITPSVAANLLHTTGLNVIACIGNPTFFPDAPPEIDLGAVKERAVCVARLDPVKGHGHLLAAWKILLDRGLGYHLDLVGEGNLRTDLEAQSARNGTGHLIHFLGFTNDVAALINNSLFAILVSEIEGQGIVTLEAAARGRASILTAVPGSIDLLPPGRKLKNGVQFGDVQALADALEEWFTYPDQAIREGRLFFEYLKTSSDPDAIAGEYKKIYRDIIAGTI